MNKLLNISFDLDLMFDLYTLDGNFIEKSQYIPRSFTGIADWLCIKKYWVVNGVYHRIGGPAIECANGEKLWFIDGEEVTINQHNLLVDIMKLKGLLK